MSEIEVLQSQVERLAEVLRIQEATIELILSTQDKILRGLHILATSDGQ